MRRRNDDRIQDKDAGQTSQALQQVSAPWLGTAVLVL
jgi:hypothetical protein